MDASSDHAQPASPEVDANGTGPAGRLLTYDLDDLDMDVFEIAEKDGPVIESLTGAHGMIEVGASCCGEEWLKCCWSGSCCCCS